MIEGTDITFVIYYSPTAKYFGINSGNHYTGLKLKTSEEVWQAIQKEIKGE